MITFFAKVIIAFVVTGILLALVRLLVWKTMLLSVVTLQQELVLQEFFLTVKSMMFM